MFMMCDTSDSDVQIGFDHDIPMSSTNPLAFTPNHTSKDPGNDVTKRCVASNTCFSFAKKGRIKGYLIKFSLLLRSLNIR